MRSVGALAAAALLVAGLAGCDRGGPKFHNTDVTGSGIAKDGFTLTDHTGATRTLADYRGKVVVMFFGFTHCPDVCPTTMVETAEAMKLLGPKAERVQVLFVTVDPERDTPEMLAKYVPAFHPRFVGLWGDPETIARTAKDFKVFYQKGQQSSSGSYSIDHTAGSYVFDTEGRLRLFTRYGVGAQALADDISQLLD
ncbi:SCO family protein [Burkholderiaceae bacterium FT117]|uniref:SCO family protein n=1 Tax=Zeimonas sediminis TaxID=2944268 RepID=UPI0023431AD8|nr:SCO family protein [Zeimonas sediminis]MCM5571704.1 SCO family protein [Zeimonas sediminis]